VTFQNFRTLPAPSIVASGSASEAPVDEVLLAWLVRLGVVHEAGTWLTWDQATAALNP